MGQLTHDNNLGATHTMHHLWVNSRRASLKGNSHVTSLKEQLTHASIKGNSLSASLMGQLTQGQLKQAPLHIGHHP